MKYYSRFLLAWVSLTLWMAQAAQQDVNLYVLEKSQWYRQSSADTLVLASFSPGAYGDGLKNPFEFFTLVVIPSGGSLSGATVVPPGGSLLRMVARPAQSALVFYEEFATKAAMDNAYPDGTYQFSMATVHNGLIEPSLTLTGNTYPTVPSFLNFDSSRVVRSDTAVTFSWKPFADAIGDDSLSFRIFDDKGVVIFEVPGGTSPSVLSASPPVGLLAPSRRYSAQLLFFKSTDLDFSSYPNAIGAAEYASITTMDFSTGPRILSIRRQSGNSVITAEVRAGAHYELEYSSTMAAGSWTVDRAVDAIGSQLEITTPAGAGATVFFRLVER